MPNVEQINHIPSHQGLLTSFNQATEPAKGAGMYGEHQDDITQQRSIGTPDRSSYVQLKKIGSPEEPDFYREEMRAEVRRKTREGHDLSVVTDHRSPEELRHEFDGRLPERTILMRTSQDGFKIEKFRSSDNPVVARMVAGIAIKNTEQAARASLAEVKNKAA